MGNGTIGGLAAGSNVAVEPTGSLHIGGNVSFGAASAYRLDVTPAAQPGELIAGGAAALYGGVVQVIATPGQYASLAASPILTATGGVAGQFAGVTSNLTILVPTLVYKPDEVDLFLRFAPLASFARTSNEVSVANAIQGNFSGALFDRAAVLPAGDMDQAFDATSGEIYASLRSALLEEGQALRQSISDRLHDAVAGNVPAVWGRVFGSWGGIHTDGNAATLQTDFSSLIIGADTDLDAGIRGGAYVGYGQAQGLATARNSSFAAKGTQVGLYAAYTDDAFSLEAGTGTSWGVARMNRQVRFNDFSESDTARPSTRATQAFAEANYDMAAGDDIDFEPFANAGWIEASTGAFRETGGNQRAVRDRQPKRRNNFHAGLQVCRIICGRRRFGKSSLTQRSAGCAGFSGLTPVSRLTFEATGSGFTVLGTPLDRDEAVADLGISFRPVSSIVASFSYSGTLSQKVHDNGIHADLAWAF